jgi:glucosylceramidase
MERALLVPELKLDVATLSLINPSSRALTVLRERLAGDWRIPPNAILCYETNPHTRAVFHETTRHWQSSAAEIPSPPRTTNFIYANARLNEHTSPLTFGTSLTDSAVLQLEAMSEEQTAALFEVHFGICHMTVVRVPMGSCDFSLGSYSFLPLQPPDVMEGKFDEIEWVRDNFAFPAPDLARIKWLRKIQVRFPDLRILLAPWSAPPWMKTSESFVGGELKLEYFSLWARALVEYARRYQQEGLPVVALSIQNEPYQLPYFVQQTWETMFFNPQQLAHLSGLVAEYGGPPLLIGDDQRANLPAIAQSTFDYVGPQKVWAVGVHGYLWPGKCAANTRRLGTDHFQGKPVLVTEFCTGFSSILSNPRGRQIGATRHAAQYMRDLMFSLYPGDCSGYIDWNLVLNKEGGPNWAKNHVDSLSWFDHETKDLHVGFTAFLFAHVACFGSQRRIFDCEAVGAAPLVLCVGDQKFLFVTVFNDAWWGTQEFCLVVRGRFLFDSLQHRSAKTYIIPRH